jgi:hypothetical protein
MAHKSKKKRRKWRRLAKFDVPGPLESYAPLGMVEPIPCIDESQLERRYLEPEGLYTDGEIGEGPIVV